MINSQQKTGKFYGDQYYVNYLNANIKRMFLSSFKSNIDPDGQHEKTCYKLSVCVPTTAQEGLGLLRSNGLNYTGFYKLPNCKSQLPIDRHYY